MAGGIAEGAAGEVIIRTGLPLVTRKYAQASQLGRFVLKDDAGICAAGIVI
jgi:translation elongation factor EF-1alpha